MDGATNDRIGLGMLPPQAIELEESVLGAMMLERDSVPVALSILRPEDLYKDWNQEILSAIINLDNKNSPVDIKTVSHELKEMGKLELVGGSHYVTGLTAKVNSAANIEYHSRIIKQASIRRHLIQISSKLQRDAYEDTIDVFKLLDWADNELIQIGEGIHGSNYINVGERIIEVLDEVSELKKAKEEQGTVGLASGIKELDRATGGFRDTDFIVIAARPGMGKTALIGSILRNIGVYQKEPIALFSLEMSWRQIVMRMLAADSEIAMNKIRDGLVVDYEFEAISQSANKFIGKNIIIDDIPSLDVVQLKSKARLFKKRHGIKMLIIDYLQLAEDKGKRGDKGSTREQEISRVSRACKAIAKELDIPVIALSQLSRAVETRGGNKRPMLSDLRESGSIEQDADMVMFLYRPEYYGLTEDEEGISTKGMGIVDIAKFRNGSTGEVWLRFIGKFTKWQDPSEEPIIAGSREDQGFPTSSQDAKEDKEQFTITLPPKKDGDEFTTDDDLPF